MRRASENILETQRKIADQAHILFAERPPSGIAGWRRGWIAENGSEGARDALLSASPVPERRVTVVSNRKLDRPAIS